eukprot:2759082-Lingulodinium_polyedra.AAC.1
MAQRPLGPTSRPGSACLPGAARPGESCRRAASHLQARQRPRGRSRLVPSRARGPAGLFAPVGGRLPGSVLRSRRP